MKTPIHFVVSLIVSSLFGSILLVGCKKTPDLLYSVDVTNMGSNEVWIDNFKMGDGDESTVGVGLLIPGGNAGYGPIFGTPNETVNFHWKDTKKGIEKQVRIQIRLPHCFFNKEFQPTIIFHIDPNSNAVIVTYRIFESKLHDFVEVDSDGNRVPQKLPH